MNNQSTDLLEEKIHFAVESVEPDQEFTDALWEKIIRTSQESEWIPIFQRFFSKPVWNIAMALVTAAFAIMAIGPQNVAAAFKNLISYLPGIGFVQNDNKTLFLPEPISVEKNGVTLVVEQAIADTTRTVVTYHFENLPQKAGSGVDACFYDKNELITMDGKTKYPTGGGVQGNQARIEFAPLAEGEQEASIHIAQNFPDPQCTAPEEWDVNLVFGLMPPTVTLMPVISAEETGLPTAEPMKQSPDHKSTEISTVGSDIRLQIDQIVALGDGYLIDGRLAHENAEWINATIDFETLRVTDASGNSIPVETTSDDWKETRFIFKIVGTHFENPLTMQVSRISVHAIVDESDTINFDAGNDPEIGQKWTLNKELSILGQKVTVEDIEVVSNDPESGGNSITEKGYSFRITGNPDIKSLDFECKGQNYGIGGGWGGSTNKEESALRINQYYQNGLPKGMVTCNVNNFMFQLNGNWQYQWQLPE